MRHGSRLLVFAGSLIGGLIALAGSRAQAQSPDAAHEARRVVDVFFAATNAGRWADAAMFIDLPPFEKSFRRFVNYARSDLPRPTMTVEELMAQDSTMPRAVAEWQIASMRKHVEKRRFHDFSEQYAGITSFRALQALTPIEALARALEAEDPGARLRRALPEKGCPGIAIDSARYIAAFKLKTLGAAAVDDSTVYVLVTDFTQNHFPDPPYSPTPNLVRVTRARQGWRIVYDGELLRGGSTWMVGCGSGR